MITKTLVKSIYKIEDTRTKRSISITHTDKHLEIATDDGDDDFVFKSVNTPKTKERWRNIARLIMRACYNV